MNLHAVTLNETTKLDSQTFLSFFFLLFAPWQVYYISAIKQYFLVKWKTHCGGHCGNWGLGLLLPAFVFVVVVGKL